MNKKRARNGKLEQQSGEKTRCARLLVGGESRQRADNHQLQ